MPENHELSHHCRFGHCHHCFADIAGTAILLVFYCLNLYHLVFGLFGLVALPMMLQCQSWFVPLMVCSTIGSPNPVGRRAISSG
jgi:hypothetical protein